MGLVAELAAIRHLTVREFPLAVDSCPTRIDAANIRHRRLEERDRMIDIAGRGEAAKRQSNTFRSISLAEPYGSKHVRARHHA